MGELIRLQDHRRRKNIVARVGRRLPVRPRTRAAIAAVRSLSDEQRVRLGAALDARWTQGTATNSNSKVRTD